MLVLSALRSFVPCFGGVWEVCCWINALAMHRIKTLVIFIWLNVSLGGLESLLSLSAINQSISITAAEKRRCIPVYLHFPRPLPHCPPPSAAARQPPSDSGEGWRVVETSHYHQPTRDTQSIAMSTTRKLVLSLPRWLLLRSPIIHHVRWSPSNLKLSIMKHERDIMTQCGQVLVCCTCCRDLCQYVPICFSWSQVTIELNNKRVSGDLKLGP